MRRNEKAELVRLLNLYQAELLTQDIKCKDTAMQLGVKSQYEHARVIVAKLSIELGKEIKAYY